MNKERSLLGSLTDELAFKIFTDGVFSFIPGQREDSACAGEFDALCFKYFPFFDSSLGAGWLFDKEAIERVKHMLDDYKADYAELSINSVTIHRN